MRFLAITYPDSAEPTPESMQALMKLQQDGTEAGWLVETGAITAAESAPKLHFENGEFSVVDGPFAESKEVVAGYAILQVNSKEEAIALTRRFYEVIGHGKGELRRLYSQVEFQP